MFKLPYGEHRGLRPGWVYRFGLDRVRCEPYGESHQGGNRATGYSVGPGFACGRGTDKDGEKNAGVGASEDNFNLALQTEDGRYYFLTRSSLAEANYKQYSLMPRDYGTRPDEQGAR